MNESIDIITNDSIENDNFQNENQLQNDSVNIERLKKFASSNIIFILLLVFFLIIIISYIFVKSSKLNTETQPIDDNNFKKTYQ